MIKLWRFSHKPEVKLNIRDNQDLEKYPDLRKIREAIVFVFDGMLENSDEEQIEAERFVNSLLSGDTTNVTMRIERGEFFNLLDENGIEPNLQNRELLINFAFFYLLTTRKCLEASKNVANFLNTKYKNDFVAGPLENKPSLSKPGKYFADHFVTVIYSKPTGMWYAVSPANIFNIHFDFPKFNKQIFQRATDVLMAKTYDNLIEQIQKVEGGAWPAKQKRFDGVGDLSKPVTPV